MPAHRYVEENGSAAMLAANRSASVTHLHVHQVQIRLPTLALKSLGDKKFKTGVSVTPQKITKTANYKSKTIIRTITQVLGARTGERYLLNCFCIKSTILMSLALALLSIGPCILAGCLF